jgi:phosphinothricin acetyltransferase
VTSNPTSVIVRDARVDDMVVVCDLYNAVIGTTVAWSETPESPDERMTWFEEQQHNGYPVLVADAGGEVVGFTSYGSFRGAGRWPGYRHTVEHTIHVDRDHWGAGIGRRMLAELIERASAVGMHAMIGAIDADNVASLRFHERLGFHEVARMPEVGFLFGHWLDLVLVQRILES